MTSWICLRWQTMTLYDMLDLTEDEVRGCATSSKWSMRRKAALCPALSLDMLIDMRYDEDWRVRTVVESRLSKLDIMDLLGEG